MKTLITKSFLAFTLLAAFLVFTAATPTPTPPAKWELLGKRTVNYKLDKDQIAVTFREGRFNALQFRVKRNGLNMHHCTIHFANGDIQKVALKKNFLPNSASRVINLQGRNRIISKVVFWYDSKNKRPVKSLVQLWGRH